MNCTFYNPHYSCTVKANKVLPQKAKNNGVNLYAKLEYFNPLGSVKDRVAIAFIDAAERSGALRPGQTVIEATAGNTGSDYYNIIIIIIIIIN